MVLEQDLKLGTTVWIEHTEQGDVTHKVKLILEKQPSDREFCKVCQQGQLLLMGHLIQHGILDDKIYAVTFCQHCQSVTAFVYHVHSRYLDLPDNAEVNGV